MKIRNNFVSNSSSTSYVIENISKTKKTIIDFVIENKKLVDKHNREYQDNISLGEIIKDAEALLKEDKKLYTWGPKQEKNIIFGDSQGTQIGLLYDYVLRDINESKSFRWFVDEYLR